jgi:regulator of protease activity HflC (stomatin/prohibitin superfamily)
MLSVDRNAFAETFCNELKNRIYEYNTGIEIVDVVLESIHPPVDVASIYQNIISAEITAEKYLFDAEAEAAIKIASAEEQKNLAIAQAKADNYTRIAAAKADVAEFVASLNSDNTYGDMYRYYKYMNAIGKAYGSSKLVIVGEGVDSSNIYFGNLVTTPLN